MLNTTLTTGNNGKCKKMENKHTFFLCCIFIILTKIAKYQHL